MNKAKRVLALILSMIMVMTIPVISVAEEVVEELDFNLMSLLPIEEVDAYIDLAEIPLEKLPQMTVGEMFCYLKDKTSLAPVAIDPTATSVWANYFDNEGNYLYDKWEVLDFDESINILDQYITESYSVEMVIGSGNQLDTDNVRYFVDFRLPNQYSYVDLGRFVYDELYDIDVADIAWSMSSIKGDIETLEMLWYVGDLIEAGYEFEHDVINGWLKLDYEDSVKFAPTFEEEHTCGLWSLYQRMVIKTNDSTAMYRLEVNYPEYYNMFSHSVFTQDENDKRHEVESDDFYGYVSRKRKDGKDIYYYDMYSHVKSYNSYDEEYYLGLNLRRTYEYCDLKVIKGWEYDEDQIRSWIAAGEIPQELDITNEIVPEDMWNKDAGYKDFWLRNNDLEVMVCILTDNDIYIVPMSIGLYLNNNFVESDGIFADVDGERRQIYSGTSYDYEDEQVGDMWYYTETITYYLQEEYNVDDEYNVCMMFYDADSQTVDRSKVDKAVVGHYYSLEEAETVPDIKEILFPEDTFKVGAGYKADYSGEGIDFTVFADDEIFHIRIKTEKDVYIDNPEADESPEAPEVGSMDSYFRVDNLYNGDTCLDTYVVPYEYDTYYSYGYQTLLINDEDADMTAVSPEVVLGDRVKVYSGNTMEITNNSNYYNKLSSRDFTKVPTDTTRDPHNAVKYTVSAQDHSYQKNYWVTSVKKEEGPKLFVNGPDEREIFLNNYFRNVHDIFVANVGDEELTGINVTVDATNIKLDDYWVVGGEGNNTLAPFTTTTNTTANYNGELFNIARIRLVPDGEGDIEGTLTITADGQEPRVITLIGTAGNPKIDTESLQDGVKYVPYSSIITTNNMHDWNRVTFSIDEGELPDGLTMYPNGEIYGVPKEVGEFPITIKARYSHSEFEDSYADFVLTIKDNTDENINASVADGYEITTKLPTTISGTSDVEFVIDGEFNEFMDLWLDGEKLVVDIDYTAREGSTKITVRSQTFSGAGNGKHTISAEFRVGGDPNNELKTASQNFTVDSSAGSAPVVSGSGGGGGGLLSYAVIFETNGGSSIDKQSIIKGKTISELPTPVKEGYVFAGWFKDVALTQPFDASEKINSEIKLYAKWDVVIPEEAPVDASDFVDVSTEEWFYEEVQWAYTNEIMVGYNNAEFAPNESITNSMVATVLARLADVDITAYENKQVESVEGGQWYTAYANWAKETGIADDIVLDETSEITREMMGVVLMRFLEYLDKDIVVTEEFIEFADADLISDKAMNAIQTLYKLRIFKGKGNNVIDPLGNTTRAEFATLIHRVHTLLNK